MEIRTNENSDSDDDIVAATTTETVIIIIIFIRRRLWLALLFLSFFFSPWLPVCLLTPRLSLSLSQSPGCATCTHGTAGAPKNPCPMAAVFRTRYAGGKREELLRFGLRRLEFQSTIEASGLQSEMNRAEQRGHKKRGKPACQQLNGGFKGGRRRERKGKSPHHSKVPTG